MSALELYNSGGHANIFLEDFGIKGEAIPSNQHLIVSNGEAMILDPGGHKVYSKVFAATNRHLSGASLKYIFLSHQDPDIVAALNGWLMTTDAEAMISGLWKRFVMHFGVDSLAAHRIQPIPDEGMWVDLGGSKLAIIPAHFLHSCGNFQVYDATSKILYTGDLGASLCEYRVVEDFEAHAESMQGFHERYMTSQKAMQAWAAMARGLDIECIAPQHGAVFQGKEMVNRFIDWADTVKCGIDAIDQFALPPV